MQKKSQKLPEIDDNPILFPVITLHVAANRPYKPNKILSVNHMMNVQSCNFKLLFAIKSISHMSQTNHKQEIKKFIINVNINEKRFPSNKPQEQQNIGIRRE
jgi:hypothetical protein